MCSKQNQVFLRRATRPDYGICESVVCPELHIEARPTMALHTLRQLLNDAGMDRYHFGTSSWNPLSSIITSADKVVIKPNWVFHKNHSGNGLDCLVTNTTLIEAILHYVVKAQPSKICLGDAPIQGCDLPALLESCGVNEMCGRFRNQGIEITPLDFRLIKATDIHDLRGSQKSTDRSINRYVLFDLGDSSALEPISQQSKAFRVTCYDPTTMYQTHKPGHHRYLVARELVEASIVINAPKLKTHKKAGITGALKNIVGINGHKEFLPHHRKGSSTLGGDCYEQKSRFRSTVEDLLDFANTNSGPAFFRRLGASTAGAMSRMARFFDNTYDVTGSWYGNDTIWRTVIDLQRILHYGTLEGRLAPTPQRRVINITDAIIAGEYEGPLAPLPVPLGLLTLSTNSVFSDWVHAVIMGFDPFTIPLVRESIKLKWKLALFELEDLECLVDGDQCGLQDLFQVCGHVFLPPSGWEAHCEAHRGK